MGKINFGATLILSMSLLLPQSLGAESKKLLYYDTFDNVDQAEWKGSTNLMYPQKNDATYGNFLYLGEGGGLRDDSPVYKLFYGDAAKSIYSDDVKSYTIEFDASLNRAAKGDNELALMCEGYSDLTSSTYFIESNPTNYLFEIRGGQPSKADLKINGESEIAPVSHEWHHYRIDVDIESRTAKYTVTTADKTDCEGILTLGEDTNGKCQGIYFVIGKPYGRIGIDNLEIWTMTEEVVAQVPEVSLTSIGKDKREYTATFLEGETLHYTIAGDEEKTATTSPYTITVPKDKVAEGNELIVYTTVNNTESGKVTVAIEPISLAVPQIKLTSLYETDNRKGLYFGNYEFSIDNSTVILQPAATIKYTFTPESGDAQEGTETEFNATEAGTLAITATADGYEPTTAEINVEAYNKSLFIDFSALEYDEGNMAERTNKWSDDGVAWALPDDVKYYSIEDPAKYGVTLDKQDTWSLALGYGLGVHTTSQNITIKNTKPGYVAGFVVYNNPSDLTSQDEGFAMATGTSLSYFLMKLKYRTALKAVNLYTPLRPVTVTIGTAGYASFSAASNVEVPEGVTVYKARTDGNVVTLTQVKTNVIPANTGVMLHSETAGSITFEGTAEDAGGDFSGNGLIATSVEAYATIPETGTYYALKANSDEFARLKGGITLSGNKAYIAAPADGTGIMRMAVDNSTAGISSTVLPGADSAPFYNMQGMEVSKPQKGMYIHNGKKVIIK